MSSLTGGENIPSGYKKASIQNYTPQQMKLHRQQYSQVAPDSYLSRLAGGDQSMFDEMEAPALQQFSALQGNIASRFSGMGTGGRRSSGFQNTMNQAGSDFAQTLQSKRMELRNQAIQDLMGYSNQILNQKPNENFLVKKEQSPWVGIAEKFAGQIPGMIVNYATGGMA